MKCRHLTDAVASATRQALTHQIPTEDANERKWLMKQSDQRMALARRVVPDALGQRCDAVISAELARLERRRPGLSSHERRVVADVLKDLADELVLRPVRRHAAHDRAVATLFALEPEAHIVPRGRP